MLLVDTNIISELCRPRPDPGVLGWAERIKEFRLSVISVEEIAHGLAWHPNDRVLGWVEAFFSRHAILPISPEIARRAGSVRGRLAAQGSARSQADMLIAATAMVHGLTVVTRNTRDFEGCGIPLLNPFSASSP
jgi:predicted nucleic acid-binding protein